MQLEPGIRGTITRTVRAPQLAIAWGGDFSVLATPVLFGWAELACITAMREAGLRQVTVGAGFHATHKAPTPQNWVVTLEAELTRIDGRLLHFDISASDPAGVILAGSHTRGLIDPAHFIAKIADRRQLLKAKEQR